MPVSGDLAVPSERILTAFQTATGRRAPGGAVLAYNLGNLWRRLGLPQRIKSWSLTSLQHRLMKTGGGLKHARYYWLLLAEGHLNRRLFCEMLHRIAALPAPGG